MMDYLMEPVRIWMLLVLMFAPPIAQSIWHWLRNSR